jgi:hypothetical protein
VVVVTAVTRCGEGPGSQVQRTIEEPVGNLTEIKLDFFEELSTPNGSYLPPPASQFLTVPLEVRVKDGVLYIGFNAKEGVETDVSKVVRRFLPGQSSDGPSHCSSLDPSSLKLGATSIQNEVVVKLNGAYYLVLAPKPFSYNSEKAGKKILHGIQGIFEVTQGGVSYGGQDNPNNILAVLEDPRSLWAFMVGCSLTELHQEVLPNALTGGGQIVVKDNSAFQRLLEPVLDLYDCKVRFPEESSGAFPSCPLDELRFPRVKGCVSFGSPLPDNFYRSAPDVSRRPILMASLVPIDKECPDPKGLPLPGSVVFPDGEVKNGARFGIDPVTKTLVVYLTWELEIAPDAVLKDLCVADEYYDKTTGEVLVPILDKGVVLMKLNADREPTGGFFQLVDGKLVQIPWTDSDLKEIYGGALFSLPLGTHEAESPIDPFSPWYIDREFRSLSDIVGNGRKNA